MISVISKRTFKQNKGRNMVAVLAIILTTLMFTTLFVLSQSMNKNIIEMTFKQTGYDAQASFKTITEEQADKLAAHPEVEEVGNSIVVGLAQDRRVAGRQVEVRWADESYAKHSFAMPVTGRMPEAENEIALDTMVLDRLGVEHELGAQVTIEWMADFVSKEMRTSTFILCGFWEANESSYASMAWVSREFADGIVNAIGGPNPETRMGIRMAQVTLYHDRDIEGSMERILSDLGMNGLEYNVNLAYSSEMNRMAAQENIPMYLGMILVFVAGYLIIYNIFQISVTADIQFYGRLKTLGTTKKQIKKLIYMQAGRLCIIGIPIGLLLGYLLGAALVPALISFQVGSASASPVIFIGSALFAGLTVVVSCMRPAKMAGKVSPMEALRYSDVDRIGRSRKKRQGSASLFALAWSNLGRNRKRTITVICSLTLGLTLMSCFYAKNMSFDMDKYLESLTIADYQIDEITNEAYMTGYDPQSITLEGELPRLVESIEGLEQTGHLYSHETRIGLDEQTIENIEGFYTDEILSFWASYDPTGVETLREAIENKEAHSVIYGIDGIPLDVYSGEEYWENGSFDGELFATGEYVLAIGPGMEPGIKEQAMPTVSVGDKVDIEGREYTVMAVLNSLQPVTDGAYEGGPQNAFYLDFIMPTETFKENWRDNTLRKLYFNVSDDKLDEAQDKLDEYFSRIGLTLPVTSRNSMAEQYGRETRSSAVMGNAISSVIALVGVLNFVNSMITAIVSRKKEFAMIQSVGMTKSQLCKLLVFEGLDYAGLTLIVTYVLSALGVGIGVRAMVAGGYTTFHFTLLPLVLCTPLLVVFAVLIPYLCFKNLEKDSLVERLRATD
ncbi:MAG: FtsX-like permease family protein [Lachnospiraceae bacterium]|nr:FtsX-like permease family protein [Lachnospiraceae bacterium]